MARDDDRGAGFDDLFEDLDEFFTDEPDAQAEPSAAPGVPPRAERERPAETPAASAPEPTAQMPRRDWRRLQDVLGDEDDTDLDLTVATSPEYDDEVDEAGEGLLGLGQTSRAAPSRPTAPDVVSIPDQETHDEAVEPLTSLWDERVIDEVGADADRLAEEFADANTPEDVIAIEPSIPVGAAASLDAGSPTGAGTPEDAGPQVSTGTGFASSQPGRPPTSGPTRRTVRVTEPEAMSEPSFRPSNRRPLGAALRPGRGDRNLGAAIVSGVLLAAIGLILLAWHPAWFAVLVIAIVLVAQAELYRAMQRHGHQPATALGLVMGALTMAGAYWGGEAAMAFFLALTVVLSFLWFLVAPARLRDQAVTGIALTALGVLYVPLLAGYVLVILSQANQGRALVLAVIGLTFLYDVSAFVVGSNIGRRPLAPSISPKKTWEGLAGATVVTLIVAAAVIAPVVGVFSLTRALALWLVVVVFGPLGDLAESSIKRDLGVKDMGTTMPGHGGALDRIDSVLFVAPAAFYLFRLFF